MEFIAADELIEITPKNIRLRKRYLTENERKRMSPERRLAAMTRSGGPVNPSRSVYHCRHRFNLSRPAMHVLIRISPTNVIS